MQLHLHPAILPIADRGANGWNASQLRSSVSDAPTVRSLSRKQRRALQSAVAIRRNEVVTGTAMLASITNVDHIRAAARSLHTR